MEQGMAGYLFVHFTGEQKDGEQIYFSVSRDGLHWTDLNDGKPVLYSHIGECGVRDPFPVKNPLNGRYYLIATDLRSKRVRAGRQRRSAAAGISSSGNQKTSCTGKRSAPIQSASVRLAVSGRPEAVFDEEEQAFLVFFASKVKCDGEETAKHRIYAAYTKDFVTFSDTFLYMERERDVIDTTILRSNGKYYRISKDETDSRLILEESDSLRGDFKRISCPVFEKLKGMEGPEGYLLPEGRSWCVIADQFAEGKGYLPMITEDLSSGDFTILEKEKYDLGRTKKRHGGVLELSDAEYERLIKAEMEG